MLEQKYAPRPSIVRVRLALDPVGLLQPLQGQAQRRLGDAESLGNIGLCYAGAVPEGGEHAPFGLREFEVTYGIVERTTDQPRGVVDQECEALFQLGDGHGIMPYSNLCLIYFITTI